MTDWPKLHVNTIILSLYHSYIIIIVYKCVQSTIVRHHVVDAYGVMYFTFHTCDLDL